MSKIMDSESERLVKKIKANGVARRKRRDELKYSIKEIENGLVKVNRDLLAKSKDGQLLMQYYDQLNVDLMECDFLSFVRGFWGVAQTGTRFSEQWFINCICEHAEYMLDLEFLKLIISISPRSAKSTILSQMLPAWLWVVDPTEKIISASYSDDLVKRDMVISRSIIDSKKYQDNWGGVYKLREDQNEKKYYVTDKGGHRIGLTPRGKGTGFGATWVLVDDPHKAQDQTNYKALQFVYEDWWKLAMRSRHLIPETFRNLICHQRLADEDLAGTLQDKEDGWVVLSLEERFLGVKHIGYNFTDPRTKLGQLLKPDLFGEEAALREERDNPFVWEAQYMQHPSVKGGNYVKEDNLLYWSFADRPALKDFSYLLSSWDLSGGAIDEDASYTCGILIGGIGEQKWLLDWWYDKMTFPQQLKTFREMLKKYPGCNIHLIENHANGKALMDYLAVDNVKGVVPINPKDYGGSKESRFFSCLPNFEHKQFYMPPMDFYPLAKVFKQHLLKFPKVKTKDFVDALSQAFNWLFHNKLTIDNTSAPTHTITYTNENYSDVGNSVSLLSSMSMSEVRGLFF